MGLVGIFTYIGQKSTIHVGKCTYMDPSWISPGKKFSGSIASIDRQLLHFVEKTLLDDRESGEQATRKIPVSAVTGLVNEATEKNELTNPWVHQDRKHGSLGPKR